MIMERKNTSQYVSTILNQVNQYYVIETLLHRELIDVPSLTYTLYGSNSPYRYCDEYRYSANHRFYLHRTIISTVRIMGELLNISMEPEVDLTPSLEEVLTKPSNVDYGLVCVHLGFYVAKPLWSRVGRYC